MQAGWSRRTSDAALLAANTRTAHTRLHTSSQKGNNVGIIAGPKRRNLLHKSLLLPLCWTVHNLHSHLPHAIQDAEEDLRSTSNVQVSL